MPLLVTASTARPVGVLPAVPAIAATPRRAALAALLASTLARPALAAIGVWDGKSPAYGSCPVGADGDACRVKTLERDAGRNAGYSSQVKASSSLQKNTTGGIPIADLSGPYALETRELAASIREYLALAPADPARIAAGRTLKATGVSWAAKYARGGSARAPSARRAYIAVDAIQGHLAANGAAPFPASKAAKLVVALDEVEALLAEGK